MSRKISKKNEENFIKQVENILKDIEFKESEFINSFLKAININTKYGKLNINIPRQEGKDIYIIFTSFDNPKLAIDRFECNPYTGKYNFFSSCKNDILEEFKYYINACI